MQYPGYPGKTAGWGFIGLWGHPGDPLVVATAGAGPGGSGRSVVALQAN